MPLALSAGASSAKRLLDQRRNGHRAPLDDGVRV
jgi:hypothetical protein